jgi:hypothetical protein
MISMDRYSGLVIADLIELIMTLDRLNVGCSDKRHVLEQLAAQFRGWA